jgi:Ran GTPase-activating protein (RanGAP) involved in mRNA processing and transport
VRPGADRPPERYAEAKEDLRTPDNKDFLVGHKGRKKHESFFTVELRRFRNATVVKGDTLGPAGTKHLVKELVAGACPRLTNLDLAWNKIQLRGVAALADGFRRKCSPLLANLDLRANFLTPSAIETIVTSLTVGGIKLRVLDLRANLLADDGACAVASTALSGGFETLEDLCLQNNDIRSRGLFALYQAFTADARPKLFPNIRHVSARYNKADPATLRRMRPCPPWLAF